MSVTIIYGTDNRVVPFSSGIKRTELNIDNINFITVKAGNHNNLVKFDEYHEAIKAVLSWFMFLP